MGGDSIALIVAIVILLLCSAFFSATETAFSSLNRIRIKNMADSGVKKAKLVLKLNENYDKLLFTLLVGNNIVNITAASIGTVLFVKSLGDIGVTISTIVITVAVLIFGEISPKSLAKDHPEKFAIFAAPLIRLLIFVFTPITFLFSLWKKLISKVFKTKKADDAITEEEFLTIIEEAEQDGAINEEDKQLLHKVIDFDDSKAHDIMTPRVDVVAIPKEATSDEITEVFIQTDYSRLPVYDGTIDNIIGVIHLRDFFELRLKNKDISEIISPVIFTAPTAKISDMLKMLQTKKSHFAVVTDEYGGTAGIVTMEDILEEIVGEIWDEHDEVIEDVIKQEDGSYKVACSMELGTMLDVFGLEDTFDSTTVGGWVMEQLGAIPKKGDSFSHDKLFVTISKVDHRRAVEIIVVDNGGTDKDTELPD